VFIKNVIRLLSQVIMVTMCQLSVLTDELWESSPMLCLHKQESHRKNLNYKHILGEVVLAQQSNIIRGMHCVTPVKALFTELPECSGIHFGYRFYAVL